jgi:hypothetical protein
MDALKLAALDEDDLKIVSAHVQDAVMNVADLDFSPKGKHFTISMNRFVWERAGGVFSRRNERRRAVLNFDRVLSVRSSGIDMKQKEDVLSLLAVRFSAGETPAGTIDLTFAGNATVRLEVECIEARLADVGGAWEAASRPIHKA